MKGSAFGTIIQIGDILVSEDVVAEYFACDYAACKGRCCTAGDSGAPLDESEPEQLERWYGRYSPLMSEAGREAVRRTGFFMLDRDGDMVTPLSEGTCECAFTHFTPDGAALCAIEKCFEAGLCRWRKPVSCSLYPIRITKLTGGGQALNVHHWDICADAFEKGRREGIRVYQFLKNVLTEHFGEEFYAALCAAADHVNQPQED